MSTPNPPKVAGIDSTVSAPTDTAPRLDVVPAPPGLEIQDRLAGWVSDLGTLHELVGRLARTRTLDSALHELLGAGAALVGARRGLVALEPADGLGPVTTLGLGLSHSDLGLLETVPRHASPYGRLLDGVDADVDGPERADGSGPGGPGRPDGPGDPPGTGHGNPVGRTGQPPEPVAVPDLLADPGLDPRQREAAVRLGYGASYAVPLTSAGQTAVPARLGAAVWLYDEPASPMERQRRLIALYARHAGEHLARLLELERVRAHAALLAAELLPGRLPLVPGVRLAARHRTGPRGGGDWYDALPLPEGALSLAVGSVSGYGPAAMAATGRLRAALRAYAVMEGEDPVAVLSDLELLLRLTEPAHTATALLAYAEPGPRKIVLAGAGHAPPLVVGDRRTEYIETTLSAPLGMLSCWQAPSVELWPAPGETVLLYTDGLLRRTGGPTDRAFERLHAAAASVPAAGRDDPEAIADHVLRTLAPERPGSGSPVPGRPGPGTGDGPGAADEQDVVLLAARFD